MKSRPERVYALLVEADPVPELERFSKKSTQPLLSVVPDQPETTDPATPEGRRPRLRVGHLLAGAAVAVVTLLSVALLTRTTGSDVAAITPEQDALERVEASFEAVAEGRIDDLDEILGQEQTEADHLFWEFNSILVRAHPRDIRSCDITQTVGPLIMIECLVVDSDPVFEATGVSEQIYPFRYRDGVITWQEFRLPDGGNGDPFAGAATYADYFARFLPAQFDESCSRSSVEDAIFNGSMVLTPRCAELMVDHADDIAAWVGAGRPDVWEQ